MDSREGINSGVTVIGAEAPSSYHMAPRAENSTPVARASAVTPSPFPAPSPSPVTAGLTGTLDKKKRGRPRKYGPDVPTPGQMSPTPISASAPSSANVNFSAENPSGSRPTVSEKRQRQKIPSDSLGGSAQCSSGGNFAPHIIKVNTGEDVTMKVISFSQQGPRAICILSARGSISNVTLRQPDSLGGTLTYEGRFDIISLSGSFTPAEVGGSRVSRCGGMSITLVSADGRIVGGQLAGLLIAASPVDLVVGSFLPSNDQELRPKKNKYEFKHVPTGLATAAVHAPSVEQNNFNAHDHNSSVCHHQDYATSATIFQSEDNWTIMPTSQDARKSTDINIALQE